MKFRFFSLLAVALSLAAMVSCQNDISQVGTSLTGDAVEIVIDSTYTVEGKTITVTSIRPKSSEQMIGQISIPAYGTLRSDVVAQFLPSTELDTADFSAENVDSIFLNLRYTNNAFVGDSVAPMRITVYPLTRQINADISSDFNPDGYYSPTPLGSKVYNASTLDSAGVTTVSSKGVDIKLPTEFGRRLFKAFQDNPASYASGETFARDVFPGIYMTNTFGTGRLTVMTTCAMTLYMRKIYTPEGETKLDTLDATHLYYLTTPEVVSNNNLTYTMSDNLKNLIDEGHTLMVAPCGTEIEFTFPLEKILADYRSHSDRVSVINTNKLPDNITSFYSTYSATSQAYNFNNLRSYIVEMAGRENVSAEDFTFCLIPVQVSFESLANSGYYYTSSSTESDVQPYPTTPARADIRFDKAKIKFTYSLKKN